MHCASVTVLELVLKQRFVLVLKRSCILVIHDSSATWWRRPIGCFKLQIIFRKRATNYRAILRKITFENKASYGSLPPCT